MSDHLKKKSWTKTDIINLDRLAARIAAGANVNKELERDYSADEYHMTYPLGTAAFHGNIEACRMLLEAGADPKVGRQGLVSPLCLVIEGRNPKRAERRFSEETMRELMGLLFKAGASKNGHIIVGDSVRHDKSPLYFAVEHSDVAAVACLAELGVNLNKRIMYEAVSGGRAEVPALKIASEKGRPSVVAALLRHGADDECLRNTGNGATPFQECVFQGHVEAVEYYVRERGEDIAQRVSGRTLLQVARSKEVRALLKALKTESAVERAVDSQTQDSKPVVVVEKGRGLAL